VGGYLLARVARAGKFVSRNGGSTGRSHAAKKPEDVAAGVVRPAVAGRVTGVRATLSHDVIMAHSL